MGWRCIVKGSTIALLLVVASCGPSKGTRSDASGIGGNGLGGAGGGGVSGSGGTGGSGAGGSVAGGGGGSGTGGSGGGATTVTRKFALSLSNQRDVDILFLIDNSSSMAAAQTTLRQSFGRFVAALRTAPGGLPNLHVAVVSSDMGAGDGSIAGCNSTGGNQGIFQYTGRGTCTTGLQTGATFISDVGGVKNYTGNLEDVLGCIASLGESGCGFEHQFAAITRALGVDGAGVAPAENQAFLRPDAYLAVILLTNEDDCSAAPGAGPNSRIPLFDTMANTNMASQLGPPQNFRCNEFGHLCARGSGAPMHPNRNAPNLDMTQMVTYDTCASNDGEGYLLSAADTANRLKSLKSDPSKIFVAAITGPASPYTVTWKAPSTADTSCSGNGQSCPWPVMAHACTAANGSFADPGVRTTAFVSQFGDHGQASSICDADFGPALEGLAAKLGAAIAGPCISDPIADDPSRAGYQPLCSAQVSFATAQGTITDQAVPPCADSGGATPCWSLSTDATRCQRPQITFGASQPATAVVARYECAVCSSGVVGQGCSDPTRTGDTVARIPLFGAVCEVGAGVTGGPGGVSIASITPQCGSGACLSPAPDLGNVTTGPLCTSSCTTTADCAGGTLGNTNDPSDRRCKKGFVCMVPTTVGDLCCQQMCVCRDFLAEPVGGFKTPAVCVPGTVGTCANVH